jgi:glycosyltransferase involved in cell wall biosynthesis
MRILHVIDGIGVGGAELVLIQLIERLQARGVHNIVLTLTPAGILRDRLIASGAELVEMNMAKGRLPWAGLLGMVRAMRQSKPDVIQGWMYHGNFAAMVLRDLSMLHTPMFWSIHNTLEPKQPFAAVTRLAYLACRVMSFRPRSIIYVSRAAADQHAAAGFRTTPASIIPNGTNCDHFTPSSIKRAKVRSALGLEDDDFVLGCFARWAAMKGHPLLFEAISRLKEQGLRPRLLLAGTRMELSNPELKGLIQQFGVEAECICLGERSDMQDLMAAIDGLVLSSIYGEAFPMVLGEAMACQIPCVATDVGDSAYLVGEAGFIVPPSDVGALTDALAKLIRMSPQNRAALGTLARDRVTSRFSIDTMTDAYLQLYRTSARTNAAVSSTVME